MRIYFTVIYARDAFLEMKKTLFIVNFVDLALQAAKKTHIIAKFAITAISKINLFIVTTVDNALRLSKSLSTMNALKKDFQDAQLAQVRQKNPKD